MIDIVYKYNIEMKFINGSEIIDIESSAIRLLMIDYDYINTDDIHAPIAACTANLDIIVYNKMQTNSKDGRILLKLSKFKSNDNNPIPITYIEKQLKYSFTDGEVEYELDGEKQGTGTSYRQVSFVMIDIEDVDKNKGFLQKNFGSINTMTVISVMNQDMKFIIEPFSNNTTGPKWIPALSSCYTLLEYLNYHWTFYKTGYRFFQNWDGVAYILSYSGRALDVGDGTYKNIRIKTSKQLNNQNGNLQGMGIDSSNRLYNIEVDSKDTTILTNNISAADYNNLSCLMADSSIIKRKLNINGYSGSDKTKTLKLQTTNPLIVDNIAFQLEYSGTVFTFTKTGIDCSVVVPYKEYMIENIEPYTKENGKYILTNKKETFAQDGDSFICSVVCTLKKTP